MEEKHISVPESQADVDAAAKYEIKRYPPPLFEIFKPAKAFFVIGAIAVGACVFIDRTDYPRIFGLAVIAMFVAVSAAFVAAYFCVTNILCPICMRKCKSSFLPNGNHSAICTHCMTEWDTGLGTD